MLSAVIPSVLSYPAMPIARQLVHQRYVHPGPLVLGAAPLKVLTSTADRDRTVSRRSKPSSRTSLRANSHTLGTVYRPPGCDDLMGEQPNPWDRLQPQVAMSAFLMGEQPNPWDRLQPQVAMSAFMGEQPNPWDVLPPQDAMSRHSRCKHTPSI